MKDNDFTITLESYSRRIRRWATRRHIEQEGYSCETWYEEMVTLKKELSLDRYLGGPGSVYDAQETGADRSSDRNFEYFAPYGGEVWHHVHGQLDWVDELIMSFGQADPNAMLALIGSVRMVPEYLLGEPSWRDATALATLQHIGDAAQPLYAEILLQSAMEELTYWNGATATAYRDTFGRHGEYWAEICNNNYTLGEGILSGAEAQLAIYAAARESVDNVCDKTIEALWGVNESDNSGNAALLSIIGAVITITVGVVSLGVAAPITAGAMVSFVGSIAASGVSASIGINTAASEDSAQNRDVAISGETAMDVLSAMRRELDNVKAYGDEEESTLMESLQEAGATVSENRHLFEIMFANGVPTDDMGERVSMETGDLEHAATVLFPQSADRVLGAHAVLAASSEGDAAFASDWNAGPTPVQGPWLTLRDLLQDLTAANGEKIRYAGNFLLDYAIETGVVDEASAAELDKTYEHFSGTEVETSAYVPADHLSAG